MPKYIRGKTKLDNGSTLVSRNLEYHHNGMKPLQILKQRIKKSTPHSLAGVNFNRKLEVPKPTGTCLSKLRVGTKL